VANVQFHIEWYKPRRVILALMLSMLIHGIVLSLVPAWRIKNSKPEPVLSVQLPEFVRPEPTPVPPLVKSQPKTIPVPTLAERARSEFKLPRLPKIETPAKIETEATPQPQAKPLEAPPPVAPAPAQPEPMVVAKAAPDALLLDSYGKAISSLIARYQSYPPKARMRGWQGTAQVQLVVSPTGKMVNAAILRSSGFEVLDDEALEMVQQAAAAPLPPPPDSLRGRELTVMVPIVFRLSD